MLRDVPAFDPLLVLAHDPEPTLVVDARAQRGAELDRARGELRTSRAPGSPATRWSALLPRRRARSKATRRRTTAACSRASRAATSRRRRRRGRTLVRDAGRVVAISAGRRPGRRLCPLPDGGRSGSSALFGDAPVLVALLSGDRHVVEFANATVRDLWGVASEGDVLSRRLRRPGPPRPRLRRDPRERARHRIAFTAVRCTSASTDRPAPASGVTRATAGSTSSTRRCATRRGVPRGARGRCQVTTARPARRAAARTARSQAIAALLRRVTDAAVVGTWSSTARA